MRKVFNLNFNSEIQNLVQGLCKPFTHGHHTGGVNEWDVNLEHLLDFFNYHKNSMFMVIYGFLDK